MCYVPARWSSVFQRLPAASTITLDGVWATQHADTFKPLPQWLQPWRDSVFVMVSEESFLVDTVVSATAAGSPFPVSPSMSRTSSPLGLLAPALPSPKRASGGATISDSPRSAFRSPKSLPAAGSPKRRLEVMLFSVFPGGGGDAKHAQVPPLQSLPPVTGVPPPLNLAELLSSDARAYDAGSPPILVSFVPAAAPSPIAKRPAIGLATNLP